MDESAYKIKTENFEGPLDLLLSLIEKRKLHISDVSLSQVTDDYINYIKMHLSGDLPNITSFIAIASTLVLVKSKILIGAKFETDDEAMQVTKILESRLLLLESLRKGVGNYKKKIISPYVDFLKRRPIILNTFTPTESINAQNLFLIVGTILGSLKENNQKLQKVEVVRIMTLDEMINKISKVFNEINSEISFNKLTKSIETSDMTFKEKKFSVIVSFLAVLELMHGGLIDLEQESNYGQIICNPLDTFEKINEKFKR